MALRLAGWMRVIFYEMDSPLPPALTDHTACPGLGLLSCELLVILVLYYVLRTTVLRYFSNNIYRLTGQAHPSP